MLLGMMFAGLFAQVLCVMREPECTCSKFHYEEQTLEKMIRTEMKFHVLQENLDAKLDWTALPRNCKTCQNQLIFISSQFEDRLNSNLRYPRLIPESAT